MIPTFGQNIEDFLLSLQGRNVAVGVHDGGCAIGKLLGMNATDGILVEWQYVDWKGNRPTEQTFIPWSAVLYLRRTDDEEDVELSGEHKAEMTQEDMLAVLRNALER